MSTFTARPSWPLPMGVLQAESIHTVRTWLPGVCSEANAVEHQFSDRQTAEHFADRCRKLGAESVVD